MELGYIEIDEFKKLYRQKLKSLGHEVNEFLITKILAFTQGHPYYSSLFLQQWTLQNDIPKDTEKAFEYLIETIITIEQPYMEKMWEEVSLSKDQRHLILSLAESKKPYSSLDIRRINVSRTISTLKNKGIILKKKDGYSFTDPIFEAWIRRNVLKDF